MSHMKHRLLKMMWLLAPLLLARVSGQSTSPTSPLLLAPLLLARVSGQSCSSTSPSCLLLLAPLLLARVSGQSCGPTSSSCPESRCGTDSLGYRCQDSGECWNKEFVCDGPSFTQCEDGSDEGHEPGQGCNLYPTSHCASSGGLRHYRCNITLVAI